MAATATIERKAPTDTGRCGEPAGYQRHYKRGERACRPCRTAKYRQVQSWRRRVRQTLLSREGARPLDSQQAFGRFAGRDVQHRFEGRDVSMCWACWGWRDDPRHPVTGGPGGGTVSFPTEQCRTCHAQIIWAVTANGKDMPVDAEPAKQGNVALSTNDKGVVLARVVPAHLAFGRTDLRLSHFVKCPQASKWRRR